MRKSKNKLGSDAFCTDDVDIFSMCIDNFFDDGQAKTCPFFVLAARGIKLVKAFPDTFDALFWDSGAMILDRDKDLRSLFIRKNINRRIRL